MRTLQIVLSNFRTEHAQLWDLTFAGSILAFLIPIIIIFPLQRFFIAGITSTGSKE
ncbi:hypothetical protein FACS189491_09840 [Spirochaetia bacterium]|nr:hypothetical protein FACS189491_09840 [Spirochaetia bacterium]